MTHGIKTCQTLILKLVFEQTAVFVPHVHVFCTFIFSCWRLKSLSTGRDVPEMVLLSNLELLKI